jgi:D-glycero-alpha-D-manno-heptose-7-phosphate kinase
VKAVTASAPARVDLAGGTLDLWPLYLLHEGSCTVNFAIDKRARARVAGIDGGFEFFSRDLGFRRRFESASEARNSPESGLAAEAALAMGCPTGVRIEVESAVPFGSGLGGSSALCVAIVSALARAAGRALSVEECVVFCRDIETRLLGVPAGTQDYEAALRGGFNVIAYSPGQTSVTRPELDLETFGRHLILFDSGRAHSSGANNWDVLRARLDGDRAVAEALNAVRDAARDVAAAAGARDFEGLGRGLAREWEARRRLSPKIETPALREAARAGIAAGAWGAKACGAGGGGVMVLLAPEGKRAAVADALSEVSGGALFEARLENVGLMFET